MLYCIAGGVSPLAKLELQALPIFRRLSCYNAILKVVHRGARYAPQDTGQHGWCEGDRKRNRSHRGTNELELVLLMSLILISTCVYSHPSVLRDKCNLDLVSHVPSGYTVDDYPFETVRCYPCHQQSQPCRVYLQGAWNTEPIRCSVSYARTVSRSFLL